MVGVLLSINGRVLGLEDYPSLLIYTEIASGFSGLLVSPLPLSCYLPLDEFHRMGVGKALDIQAIAHDLDNRPGVLMNQVSHIVNAIIKWAKLVQLSW